MKEIKLTKGQVALVDDEDFVLVSQWKWKASKTPHEEKYFACRTDKKGGGMRSMYMHRLIMNAKKGDCVKHLNGNKLDNRKSNLVITTRSLVTQNQKRKKQAADSSYRGVRIAKRKGYLTKKWLAEIKVNYKIINLGYYKTEPQAALAYDKAARKYFGKEAKLNFPTFFSRLLIKLKIYFNFRCSKINGLAPRC